MKHEQLNLFGNKHKKHVVHSNAPATQHRKYSRKHWSYRQRLVHLVSSSSSISWQDVYQMLANRIINIRSISNRGREFPSTINQNHMNRAVDALYQQKHHDKHFKSINQLVKYYRVSKRSLYRYYYRKYGRNKI